jgi:hypothetical protein
MMGQTAKVPRCWKQIQLPKCFPFVCLFVFPKHKTMDKFEKLSDTKVFRASLIVP